MTEDEKLNEIIKILDLENEHLVETLATCFSNPILSEYVRGRINGNRYARGIVRSLS